MRSLSTLGSLLLLCAAAACGAVASTPVDANTSDAPAAGCGNAVCEPSETCSSCAADCGACCGNGGCQPALGEDCMTCSSDCGTCPPGCGDGTCSGTESCATCPSDCGTCPPFCGDGACNGSEDCSTCSVDCGSCPTVCGDGSCEPGEDCTTCPGDCGACPVNCGDGTCDNAMGETCMNCPGDCGPCPDVCGDGACSSSEDCSTCPGDCGGCPPFCGDGACNGTEDCMSCSGDCGPCPLCGDPSVCETGEDCATCMECCSPLTCPNGTCEMAENCMSCAADCCSVCGNLRLWYQFEETASPTGTVPVYDSSGCNNDGAASLVTRGQPGRIGNSYRFNGPGVTSAHVLVTDTMSLSGMPQLTVEAWVNHTGTSFEAVLNHGNAMGGDPFIMHTYSASDVAFTVGNYPSCSGMGSYNSAPAGVIPASSWHHMAVSSNGAVGGQVKVYLDGNLVSSGAGYGGGGHCDNAENMIVGGIDTSGGWGWEGNIDELKLWAVERTASEICQDAGGTVVGGLCAL